MGSSDTLAFDVNAAAQLCLSCGLTTTATLPFCRYCGSATSVGAPEHVGPTDIRFGSVQTTQGSSPAISFSVTPSSSFVVFADASFVPESQVAVSTFQPVGGLTGTTSLVGAVLTARHHLIGTPIEIDPWREFVKTFTDGRVELIRRVAMALSEAGSIDLLRTLPLSESEVTWWTAATLARDGRPGAAAESLRSLPPDRYAVTLPLLAELARRERSTPSLPRPDLERLVNERLASTPDDRALRQCQSWSAALCGHDWLADTEQPPHPRPDTAHGRLLAAALGVVAADAIEVPAGTPLELIDDLLDRGVPLRFPAHAQFDADHQRYITARTDPALLSDSDAAQLGFDAEVTRRQLMGRDLKNVTEPEGLQPEQRSALRLVRDGVVDDMLMQRLGPSGESLRQFLADPGVATLRDDFLADTTLWGVIEERLPPDSGDWHVPEGSARQRFLAWAALTRSVRHVYAADWRRASDTAKRVLELTKAESLRDEALNLIACAAWQTGNDEAARRALESALTGRRNTALQVNLGVVASVAAPEAAALEYARLAGEAEQLDLSAAAALRAADLWITDTTSWSQATGDAMPAAIREGLRRLVVEQLDLETFRAVLAVVATHDAEWLTTGNRLASSPHHRSAVARVYQAKAAGIEELLDALSVELRDQVAPDWVFEMRDAFIAEAISRVEADFSDGAGLFLLAVFDKAVPITPQQRAVLVPLLVLHLCGHIDPEEGDLNERFETALDHAEREARAHGFGSDLIEHYSTAWNRLASVRVMFSINTMRAMIDAYNRLIDELRGIPPHRIDQQAVRSAFEPIRSANADIEASLQRLQKRQLEADLVSAIRSVLDDSRNLRQHISEVIA